MILPMETRRRVVRAVLSVAAATLLLAGCGNTITGTALPAGAVGTNEDFRNLLTECDAVNDQQIAEAVGGSSIERGFFGAICRWDVGGTAGNVKVTFNWFETGSLDVERSTLEKLEYSIEDITVEGRRAIQSQPPNDADSCGVTAGAPDSGIIGWWVQYRPGTTHPEPCAAAVKLAELTLNLSR